MARRLLVVLAALLLLAVLIVVPRWRQGRGGGARPAGEAVEERAETQADLVAPAEGGVAASGAVGADAPADERAGVTPAAEPATDATEATLRGRFVFENGAPAAGVQLKLHGWPGNRDRELKYGLPASWEDLKVASAQDGSFPLAFEPPGAFQFKLDARLPGNAGVGWHWNALRPGASVDLGETVLRRGGTLLVAIVDAEGKRLTEGWSVYADPMPRGPALPARCYGGRPEPDGTLRIVDVTPGEVGLQANSSMAGWIHGPTVVVRAGEEVAAEIRYTGPDTSRRITVSISCRPFNEFAATDLASIQLHGAGLAPRAPEPSERFATKHVFEDVGPGSYRITIDDPRFLPWSQDGVAPGSRVSAGLVGSCRLALRVVDDATEELVTSFTARLRFRNVGFSPRESELTEPGSPLPADGVYAGIPPGDVTVVVFASGYGMAEVDVDALAPGEERAVLVRLGPGGTLAGELLASDGAAVPEQEVVLWPHVPQVEPRAEGGDVQAWNQARQARDEILRGREVAARTDERGRFAFEGLIAGRYDVTCRVGPLMEAEAFGLEVRAGERTEIQLRLPEPCFLAARVLAPPGADFGALRLQMLSTDWKPMEQKWPSYPRPSYVRGPLDAHGACRLGPVPPGSYVVRLILPESGGFTMSSGPGSDLGTVALAPGENAHDFDARASFPGSLTAFVTVNGDPLVRGRVAALGLGGSSGFPPMVGLDAEGRAAFARLVPGSYALAIKAPETPWTAAAPGPFLVQPNAPGQALVELEVSSGRLHVRDAASGMPLAAQTVLLEPSVPGLPPGAIKAVGATTDADGMLELELPTGDYLLRVDAGSIGAELARSRGAPLVWGPAGPTPAEVVIGTVGEDELVDPRRDRDQEK